MQLTPSARMQALFVVLSFASTLIFSSGCQRGYRQTVNSATKACAVGDYAQASAVTTEAAQKNDKDEADRVAYLLEAGRCTQLNDQLAESDAAFGAASEAVRPYLDTAAESKVTEAFATTAVNQTISIYRATNPERTMLETMLAMNAMIRGDRDAARLSLNRAYDWQQNAVQLNAKEIEKREGEIAKSKKSAEEKSAEAGSSSGIQTRTEFSNLDSMAAYADYADPFATYLRALFLATEPDADDQENAAFAFKRVASLHGGDKFVQTQVQGDLAVLKERQSTGTPPPHTWIVLLDGMAAHREEFSVGIAAFPYMVQSESVVNTPEFFWQDKAYPMVLISDVDRMVLGDFKQKLPLIIMQELLSTALKTAATYALSQSGGDNGSFGLLAGLMYQTVTTAADLRGWHTMPKRIFVGRMETPLDGVVALSDGATALATARVQPRSTSVVFVDVPGKGAAPAVKVSLLVPARPTLVIDATVTVPVASELAPAELNTELVPENAPL